MKKCIESQGLSFSFQQAKLEVKLVKVIVFSLGISFGYSQSDSAHFIKVHFLYGSKPKRKFKTTEYKAFGGKHGGHVTIELDDIDYGFEPAHGFHVFAHKQKFKADFVDNKLNGQPRYGSNNKTAIFIIPINTEQYNELNQIHKNYCNKTPYDYAFFGMRCASSVQNILGQIKIVKNRKRFYNILTTFYPKKLRKRLFRLARKHNYQVIKTNGSETRKWERD